MSDSVKIKFPDKDALKVIKNVRGEPMYRMSTQTLQALEELYRKQFCKACLADLKEENFQANPYDENQVNEFVNISRRLEAKGLASESIQYRYFMLYLIIGSPFLQNEGIHHHLLNCKTEEARNEYLEELIGVNLQSNKPS